MYVIIVGNAEKIQVLNGATEDEARAELVKAIQDSQLNCVLLNESQAREIGEAAYGL